MLQQQQQQQRQQMGMQDTRARTETTNGNARTRTRTETTNGNAGQGQGQRQQMGMPGQGQGQGQRQQMGMPGQGQGQGQQMGMLKNNSNVYDKQSANNLKEVMGCADGYCSLSYSSIDDSDNFEPSTNYEFLENFKSSGPLKQNQQNNTVKSETDKKYEELMSHRSNTFTAINRV